MSNTQIGAVLATLLLANHCLFAAEKDVSLRWSELEAATAGAKVKIALSNASQIEGRVYAVEPEALRIDITKTFDKNLQPKGTARIPRSAVQVMRVVTYGKAWRIGATATAASLVAVGGAAAAYGSVTSGSGRDVGPYFALGALAAAGICIGSYYLGKRADRRVTTIRIVPESR